MAKKIDRSNHYMSGNKRIVKAVRDRACRPGKKKQQVWKEGLYFPSPVRGTHNRIMSRTFAIQNKLLNVKRKVGLDDGIFLLKQFSRQYKLARKYRRELKAARLEMGRALQERDDGQKVSDGLVKQLKTLRALLPDTIDIYGDVRGG